MATITFIPKRLNETPVVFKGMTGKEIITVVSVGFCAFLPLGLVGAWLFGIAMVPTLGVVGAGLALMVGGGIMRRLRRGRPPSLLYRRLDYRLAELGWHSGGERLITQTTVFRQRRERRRNGGVS